MNFTSFLEKKFYLKKNICLTNSLRFSNKKNFSFFIENSNTRKDLNKSTNRFWRKMRGYPVRGQRTSTNGKTAKKRLWRF